MKLPSTFLRAIIVLLSLHVSFVSAQEYLWHFDLASTERPLRFTDIAVDGAGNIYTLGASFEDIDLDPGPDTVLFSIANQSNSHADVFIAKYDSSRQLLWHIPLAGITPSLSAKTTAWIELDGDSALYVAATYKGSTDFDPGPDTALITWSNPSVLNVGDLVIARYGTDGTFRWAHTMGSRRGDFLEDISVNPDGNLVICGRIVDTLDLDPGPNEVNALPDPTGINSASHIVTYDQNGTYLNHLSMPLGASATHVAINAANELYISGTIYDSVDIDLGPQTYWLPLADSVFQSGFIVKYDSNDSLLWANYLLGAMTNQGPGNLAIDANDNAYVFAAVDDIVDIRPDSTVQIIGQANALELILTKFDSIGRFDWVNYFPSSDPAEKSTENLVVSPAGDAFIAGAFNTEKMDVDPSMDSLVILNTYYDREFYQETFLAAYDPRGAVQWGFGLALSDQGSKVEALFLKDSTLYWAGTYDPAIQFAPGVTDSSSGSTPFVVAYKVKVALSSSPPPTSIDSHSFQEISLYPNPAQTAIHFSTEGMTGLVGIQVIDMQGRLVQHHFQHVQGEHVLSVKNLVSGVYLLRVQEVNGKEIRQGRFVKH